MLNYLKTNLWPEGIIVFCIAAFYLPISGWFIDILESEIYRGVLLAIGFGAVNVIAFLPITVSITKDGNQKWVLIRFFLSFILLIANIPYTSMAMNQLSPAAEATGQNETADTGDSDSSNYNITEAFSVDMGGDLSWLTGLVFAVPSFIAMMIAMSTVTSLKVGLAPYSDRKIVERLRVGDD